MMGTPIELSYEQMPKLKNVSHISIRPVSHAEITSNINKVAEHVTLQIELN